ncbi:hypothetical protein F2Q69_00050662 [Brassica cretica]|uniref:Uncharacterized protein n=1 Tax=Brassica cretica TaxID=69181 RepID=A0A8S9PTB6_BRACR|nr:hypothetical protein F2Q69_00050662 [Brassica cretica]
METTSNEAVDFRSEFLRVLHSRRSPEVPLVAECTKPVEDPVFQNDVPSTEALESCPKENINNLKEMLKEENLHLHTEGLWTKLEKLWRLKVLRLVMFHTQEGSFTKLEHPAKNILTLGIFSTEEGISTRLLQYSIFNIKRLVASPTEKGSSTKLVQ